MSVAPSEGLSMGSRSGDEVDGNGKAAGGPETVGRSEPRHRAPFVLEATTHEAWTRQLAMVLIGVLPVVLLLWLVRRMVRHFRWTDARAVRHLARFNRPVGEVLSLIDADSALA